MNDLSFVIGGLMAIGEFADEMKKRHPELTLMYDDWIAITGGAIEKIESQSEEIKELKSKVWAYETLYNNFNN